MYLYFFCRFRKELSKLTLSEERISKVVPHRIYSMAVHPAENKLLLAVGDKWGNLGKLISLMVKLMYVNICLTHTIQNGLKQGVLLLLILSYILEHTIEKSKKACRK
jgi:hypothetical protein